MNHRRNGKLVHGYRVDPTPRDLSHFEAVIAESYADDATFLNSLTAMRFFPDRAVAVVNAELVESDRSGSRTTALPEPRDRVDAIVEHFEMPRAIVEQALSCLGELRETQGGPVARGERG